MLGLTGSDKLLTNVYLVVILLTTPMGKFTLMKTIDQTEYLKSISLKQNVSLIMRGTKRVISYFFSNKLAQNTNKPND